LISRGGNLLSRHYLAPLACLIIIQATAAAIAQQCPEGREIWAGQTTTGQRVIVYFPDKTTQNQPIIFEGWTDKRIDWRITGEKACSNGVVICGIDLPTVPSNPRSDGPSEKTISSEIEFIEESETRYVVFSQLRQYSARAQIYDGLTLKADWFSRKPDQQNDETIELPSYYKPIGCIDDKAIEGIKRDVVGAWAGAGKRNVTAEILVSKGDTRELTAKLDTATDGCVGNVEVSGPVTPSPVVMRSSDDQVEQCAVSFELAADKSLVLKELEGCAVFHGAACAFSGTLKMKSSRTALDCRSYSYVIDEAQEGGGIIVSDGNVYTREEDSYYLSPEYTCSGRVCSDADGRKFSEDREGRYIVWDDGTKWKGDACPTPWKPQ
jgi:hypothetical protein